MVDLQYLPHWQDTVKTQESTYRLWFYVVPSALCPSEAKRWVFSAASAFWKESWHADLQTDAGAKGGAGLMSEARNLTHCFLSF